MTHKTTDETILKDITALVKEEEALFAKQPMDDRAIARVEVIKVELDQAWDLLRQRRALREFGKDPDQAKVRSANIVEKYEQ
ncbi:MAG: DUF2630 family protein [Acidobacteriota bacterium]